jgi:hypothetical protein
MSRRTVPGIASKRKARDERLLDFTVLAEFANLGDDLKAWENFRVKHRSRPLFPAAMEWLYSNAQRWWHLSNLPKFRPFDNEINRICPNAPASQTTIENWAKFVSETGRLMEGSRPPLLYYRDLLRRVWGEKPDADSRRALLGFEGDWPLVLEHRGSENGQTPPLRRTGKLTRPRLMLSGAPQMLEVTTIGNATLTTSPEVTSCGLPIAVTRCTGKAIEFEFGSEFQWTIYDLMQEQWRARECKWCLDCFIKVKGAQKYCSTKCSGERKITKALNDYHETGKARRQASRAAAPRPRREKL